MAEGEWGGAFAQNLFRAVITFKRLGQNCQTGFQLRDVGINNLSAEDVAEEVAEFATTQFIKCLHTTDQVTGIDVLNLKTDEGFSITPPLTNGAAAGAPAPSYMQVTLSLKGSKRKRYGSGRMLLPVSLVDSISGNNLLPLHQTAIYEPILNDLSERFIGPAITTSMHLVHAHKAMPALGNRPALPAMWYDITSLRLNTSLSAVRSRRQGSGS
jgi:hypothetical protein